MKIEGQREKGGKVIGLGVRKLQMKAWKLVAPFPRGAHPYQVLQMECRYLGTKEEVNV